MNTRDLVSRIERLTRERMRAERVVRLDDLRPAVTPRTILVIEDDETIRAALKRTFEADGYRVVLAADGRELAGVLNETRALDLILLDVGLPWINGFELAAMMKAHADLKELPLVFLSARTSDADVKQGFSVGADDYIKKPFDLEKVKRTVRTLIHLAHE